MNEKKEYLNEERVQFVNKRLRIISLIVLLVGLLVGGGLIIKGISNSLSDKTTYTEESKQAKIDEITTRLNKEKEQLSKKKTELEGKGLTASSNYETGERYDLYIIKNALDPSFSHCSFEEFKNNTLTKKYCAIKEELREAENFDVEHEKNWSKYDNMQYYFGGLTVCLMLGMIALGLYTTSKRREILSYQAQTVMPVAQEGLEKMAPTIGKAGASIAKEMAPVYGDIAKEISKGIKEGLKEEEKEDE